MAVEQALYLLGAFVLGVLLAAGVCSGWHGRQMARIKAHVSRSDEARLLAAQQVTQARRQVEQLQRECNELRDAIRHGAVRTQALQVNPTAAPSAAEATRLYAEAKLRGPAPKEDPDAFPDTLVLRPGLR